MTRTEGFVRVEGGRVWFRSIGTGGTPLLLLHGGPSAGHDYLEPLEALGADRQVIFYDQLGCGRSDKPDNQKLWRIERFVSEVAEVRRALGLSTVHLLGHSWGGMLAIEYLLGKPAGVASAILGSTAASFPELHAEIHRLKSLLPGAVRDAMGRHEAARDFASPDYQAATMVFYKLYLCRLDPWPDCLWRSVANLNGNQAYSAMIGPNVLTGGGNLTDWDRRNRLHEIRVPTLITVGRHDEVTPACAQTLHNGIGESELALFDQSSHMAMLEQSDAYLRRVMNFLTRVDEATA